MKAGILTTKGGLLLGALALAGCMEGGGGIFGGKPDPLDFKTLDADANNSATREEFAKWGKDSGLVDAFVEKGQDIVGPVDLASGLYSIWNIEGDDLTEGEWNEGVAAFFPDKDAGIFADWDLDGDRVLDEQELVAGLSHTDLLESFDDNGDDRISPTELMSRFYQIFDVDADERLTSDEFRAGLARWVWPI